MFKCYTGLSSLGVPGVPWHTQIFADQLTLFQLGGTDYAHLITTGTLRFSDLPTALKYNPENMVRTSPHVLIRSGGPAVKRFLV